MEQYFPFSAVLSALGTTLGKSKSGTFFIATDTNTSARFGISIGKINQCTFQRFHGDDALHAILNINSARYSFSENVQFPFRPKDNVEHKTALEVLGIVLQEHPGIETQKPEPNVPLYEFPEQISNTPESKSEKTSFEEIHKHAKVKKQVYDGQIIEIDD